jgi:hypothetical protein
MLRQPLQTFKQYTALGLIAATKPFMLDYHPLLKCRVQPLHLRDAHEYWDVQGGLQSSFHLPLSIVGC